MFASRSATYAAGALALPRKPLGILDGDVSAQQGGGLFPGSAELTEVYPQRRHRGGGGQALELT
eukprot:2279852-Pyramimonas_sp.AAC.1